MEYLVERPSELRVPAAEQKPWALPLRWHQQVPGLLGDPGAIWVGGHTGHVGPAGPQFDEAQHIQPPQPHRVDGEEIAGYDPGGLLAQECPPGRIRQPWRGIQPMPTQHRADGGGRDSDAQVLEFALEALVTPARVLPGQVDDQLQHLSVQRWPAGVAVRVGPGVGDQPSVPARHRLRLDEKADQRDRGKARLMAVSSARSVGSGLGRGVWRRSTASWWRRTKISSSLAASPWASRAGSWMERHSVS